MARIVTIAGLSAALLAAATGPAGALEGTPGALSVGDRLYPELGNGGYDAQSYDVSFDYQPGVSTMDSSETMTAVATQALSEFSLDSAVAQVRSVKVNGQPATFRTDREKLIVTPAKTLPAGRAFTVEIQFVDDRAQSPRSPTSGPLPPGFQDPSPVWENTPDGFAVLGQPDREHVVFPSNDHPSDPATYTIRLTTPADLDGVAGGTLASRRQTGDRVTSVYRIDQPAPTDVVQAAVGHFREIDQTGPHGLPVHSFVPDNAPAEATDAARKTPEQIAWLEGQLGRPLPYPTYGVLGVDSPYGALALETASLSTFPALNMRLDNLATQEHELVHQYFGDTVPVRDWDDMWLSEGHATYYQMLYSAETGGQSLDDAMKDLYSSNQYQLETWGALAHLNSADSVLMGTDGGGALTLYALRNLVGDATFQRIEQTFYDTFRGRSVSTQDYIDVANRVSGQNLDGFFHDWLYTTTTPPMPGHPDWPKQ